MDILLWIVQIMLAFAFGMAGMMKAMQYEKMAADTEKMGWVNDFTPLQVKTIGVLEMMAAVGMILPMPLDILPWLTPLAATGLIFMMIGAAYTHKHRNESPMMMMNLMLLVMALFVAVGRANVS
jgi:uncharacterized membrane protein YphA (DoxX/SURF4 family)